MKLLMLIMLVSFSSKAKDFNNGCGSGWNEKFVPDKIALLGINFVQSCSEHDNCYSRCLKGGKNYNKPICKQTATEQKEGRRKICDAKFLSSMKESCEKIDFLRKHICLGVSALYAIAVRKGGSGSFAGREVPPEYFDFITSDAAKNFDFSNFVNEINQVQDIEGIPTSNRLKLIMKGGRPIMQFIGIDSTSLQPPIKIGNIYRTDLLKYGAVDLTNASKNETPLTIKNIDVKKLNLEKLKVEQRFSTIKP
ncbi:hypothetical protein [Thalassomonas sp. RHCl1]|uniref:hypothetical protein n=1 Tax=Thalassomonas sp. RHCl1 TaxID=2995320 RepID=UPI00248B0DCC|nr:hypothetical protein [Thalassomonas sp. RHCl1]